MSQEGRFTAEARRTRSHSTDETLFGTARRKHGDTEVTETHGGVEHSRGFSASFAPLRCFILRAQAADSPAGSRADTASAIHGNVAASPALPKAHAIDSDKPSS